MILDICPPQTYDSNDLPKRFLPFSLYEKQVVPSDENCLQPKKHGIIWWEMDLCLANKTNIGDLSYLTAKNNLLLGFHVFNFLNNHERGKTCLQKENGNGRTIISSRVTWHQSILVRRCTSSVEMIMRRQESRNATEVERVLDDTLSFFYV